jgi:hypothetical protein
MGRYRTWLLLGTSTLVAVPFFFGQVPANGIIAFAVTFLAVYVMTVEFVIRLGLSLAAGGLAFGIAVGIGLLLFKDKDSQGIVMVVAGAIALAAIIWCYKWLAPWLAERCPKCTTRGTINSEEIDKQFLGSTSERSNLYGDNRLVFYNKYRITYLNSCYVCGEQWQSTSESKERS